MSTNRTSISCGSNWRTSKRVVNTGRPWISLDTNFSDPVGFGDADRRKSDEIGFSVSMSRCIRSSSLLQSVLQRSCWISERILLCRSKRVMSSLSTGISMDIMVEKNESGTPEKTKREWEEGRKMRGWEVMRVLWSREGWNDNTTRKWGIRNILKENSTYINDSREKPLLSLTQLWTLHPFLVTACLRLRRRELSRYVSHEGESICSGDTPTEKKDRVKQREKENMINMILVEG